MVPLPLLLPLPPVSVSGGWHTCMMHVGPSTDLLLRAQVRTIGAVDPVVGSRGSCVPHRAVLGDRES